MRKVSLIGNSLAYCLNQERQRATDYRPGMTPEDVRAVSDKSVRQHETTRGRNAPFDGRRPRKRPHREQADGPCGVTVHSFVPKPPGRCSGAPGDRPKRSPRHIGLARISQGFAALRDCDLPHVGSGSFTSFLLFRHVR